jgi:hypothetical protein
MRKYSHIKRFILKLATKLFVTLIHAKIIKPQNYAIRNTNNIDD